jgi:phosphatidate cytidylyltransferase
LSGAAPEDLRRRIATAAIVLPPLVLALLFGPPVLLLAIIAFCLLYGLFEFFELVDGARVEPLRIAGGLAGAAFFLDTAFPGIARLPLGPAAVVLVFAGALVVGDPPRSVPGAGFTLLGAAYLGTLGGAMASLLLLPPPGAGGRRILLLLGIGMGADTAAYFVGRAFGRHRLAPALSPGKTVEGAAGGLLGGALGAVGIRALLLPSLPLPDTLLLGILIAALGALGDLFESLVKRWAGTKDSGRLFPGHGGMLDRLDSLLFGAPVLYYYFGTLR